MLPNHTPGPDGSALITITPTNYDKRGLMVTDPVTLTISLSNLYYLSSTHPTKLSHSISEHGGLELLVNRLTKLSAKIDQRSTLCFSLGLGTLGNLAACGNSKIRFQMVRAGIIPMLIPTLEKACSLLITINHTPHNPPQNCQRQSNWTVQDIEPESPVSSEFSFQFQPSDLNSDIKSHDLLMISKIVAYISKYDETRNILHHYPIYKLLEQLTVGQVVPEIRKWSVTCVRNAYKRNNLTTAPLICGYTSCAKRIVNGSISCCKCKCVFYCSKACQIMASRYHQNWCRPPKENK
ncbi:hypothetical protein HDV06_004587 [Boothiomyces sp. JEL0866]|nr:hypothetical protein HDV06_004587 [Boothiomyces sp. JEL0866]